MGTNTKPSGIFSSRNRRLARRGPATARALVLTLTLFLTAALVFASMTEVRETVRASGEIVPAGRARQIQHLTGGVVEEILVTEGQTVRAGDVLARLSAPDLHRQLDQAKAELDSVTLRLHVLKALSTGSMDGELAKPGGQTQWRDAVDYVRARQALFDAKQSNLKSQITRIDGTISKLSRSEQVARDRVDEFSVQVARLSRLQDQGHVSEFRLIEVRDRLGELKGELMSAEVALARAELDQSLKASEHAANALARDEELLTERYKLLEQQNVLRSQVDSLSAQVATLTLRAPEDGTIQSVSFPSPGEVIAPGSAMFDLMPSDVPLVAEIKVQTADIGHLNIGDPAQAKLQTFDFRKYGGVDGAVRTISPTIVLADDGSQHYRAIVALDRDYVGEGSLRRPVRAGMDVSVDIPTGQRTLIAYLLKPVDNALDAAFRER